MGISWIAIDLKFPALFLFFLLLLLFIFLKEEFVIDSLESVFSLPFFLNFQSFDFLLPVFSAVNEILLLLHLLSTAEWPFIKFFFLFFVSIAFLCSTFHLYCRTLIDSIHILSWHYIASSITERCWTASICRLHLLRLFMIVFIPLLFMVLICVFADGLVNKTHASV